MSVFTTSGIRNKNAAQQGEPSVTSLSSIDIFPPTLHATIGRLTAFGMDASMLQPDEGPAEIAVSYLPPLAGPEAACETEAERFARSAYDARYFRLWAASDNTFRLTDDTNDAEWTAGTLDEAVSELAAWVRDSESVAA